MTTVVTISHSHLRAGTRIWVSWIVLNILKKILLTRYKSGLGGMEKTNKAEPQVKTFIELYFDFPKISEKLLNLGDKKFCDSTFYFF